MCGTLNVNSHPPHLWCQQVMRQLQLIRGGLGQNKQQAEVLCQVGLVQRLGPGGADGVALGLGLRWWRQAAQGELTMRPSCPPCPYGPRQWYVLS